MVVAVATATTAAAGNVHPTYTYLWCVVRSLSLYLMYVYRIAHTCAHSCFGHFYSFHRTNGLAIV